MRDLTSRCRHAVTAAVALALTVGLPGAALAASAPDAAATWQEHRSRVALDLGEGPALPPVAATTAAGQYSAQDGIPPATCPSGTMRSRSVHTEGFEAGPPVYSEGWTAEIGDAVSGQRLGQSVLTPPPVGEVVWSGIWLGDLAVAPGTRTMLSFASRGDQPVDAAFASVNEYFAEVPASTGWTRHTYDITETTLQHPDPALPAGTIDVFFDHVLDDTASASSTWQLDDIQVYTCVAAPASGVRGDWTGEGTVDLLGTTAGGDLWLYPGRNDGTVGRGTHVGVGWSAMTWLGSPGDVTGDRRTDLVARRSDGTLWLYAGRGGGGFASGVQVGQGWGAMTAIATPGDLDGDGRPNLLARRSDGTLHMYSVTSTGAVRYQRQAGSGWNGMTWIVGMGDLDGDRLGDVVAVSGDGKLYGFRGSAVGLRGFGQIGSGWGGMTWLTSPGDMNADGRGDLVGRHSDGTLWFYAGRATGVASGQQVGSGWTGMSRIL
ncbi:MAG: FG-GAP repeat domain-containing protein [Actinomycetes bacterium]